MTCSTDPPPGARAPGGQWHARYQGWSTPITTEGHGPRSPRSRQAAVTGGPSSGQPGSAGRFARRGRAAGGDDHCSRGQHLAPGHFDLPPAGDGVDSGGGLVGSDGGTGRRRCRRDALHQASESLVEVGDAPAGGLDPGDSEVSWHTSQVGDVSGHPYQHPGQVSHVTASPQRLDPLLGAPARPARRGHRQQPEGQRAELADRHPRQLAVAHDAGAAHRRSVTAVRNPHVVQYPPGLAAPAECVRPLVESVAAQFVGAGPAPWVLASTTTTGRPARAAVAAAVSPASPAPMTTTVSLSCSRMQIRRRRPRSCDMAPETLQNVIRSRTPSSTDRPSLSSRSLTAASSPAEISRSAGLSRGRDGGPAGSA